MLRLFSLFILAVILACTGVVFLAQSRLPVLDGVLSLPELSRGASVRFDDRQVPYIEAANELDLYRVQGYVSAYHRLFQMDMLRRTALGELSEVYGAQGLVQDKLMRTVGINRIVKEDLKTLPKDVSVVLDAYCQGVNAYLSGNKDRLPLEFVLLGYSPRRWTTADTLAILKYSQYEQDESWRLDDLRQRVLDKVGAKVAGKLFERPFAAAPTVGLKKRSKSKFSSPAIAESFSNSPLTGSNGWVLNRNLSDTKGAILALDKHHRYSQPVDWYLQSLRCPTLHVAGATIPGVPGIMQGRNDKVGYGLLALKVDVQDLFLEQFSTQFPGKYKTDKGWDTASEIVEEIPVRFSDKLFFTSNLIHKVGMTRHGPLLLKGEESGVSLAWIGAQPVQKGSSSYLETILALGKAADQKTFKDALSHYSGSPLTALYVDKTGSCGFQQAGSIPLRSAGSAFGAHEGCLLTPGWTGAGEWSSVMPFASLMQGFDPAKGFFVANFEDFKPDMPINTNLYRGQRVQAVLNAYKGGAANHPGLPEMAVLQGDSQAPLAALVKATLHEAVSRSDLIDAYQISAMEALDKWDGAVLENSSGAAVYESFVRTIARRVLAAKMGGPMTNEYLERYPGWSKFVESVLKEKSSEWLPAEERTFKNFIATSFVLCIKDLRLASASDDSSRWRWGDFHKGNFPHFAASMYPQGASLLNSVFSVSAVRLSGDQDTVNTTESSMDRGKDQFASSQGSTMRLLIDMSDDDKFYQTIVLGQSGHLFSPSRQDELKNWLALKPLPIAFQTATEAKICDHRLLFTDR